MPLSLPSYQHSSFGFLKTGGNGNRNSYIACACGGSSIVFILHFNTLNI